MKLSEYHRLRRQLDKEFQDKIRALDMVYKMSGGTLEDSSSPTINNNAKQPFLPMAPKELRSTGGPYSGIVEKIREAVITFTKEFTVRNVDEFVIQKYPQYSKGKDTVRRSIIAHFLRRVVENEGTLKYVTKGRGSQPSVFQKL